MWSLAKVLSKGSHCEMLSSGMLQRASWRSVEESVAEKEKLKTWGVVVGMHGGDEAKAIAAMERGEVEARENPSSKGPRVLYSIFSME
eukprot:10528873-Lingulodinium_polyedra.AAC.1